MGLMDKMKGAMGDMSEDMKERFEELKQKEQDGSIDDRGRMELQQMREKFGK